MQNALRGPMDRAAAIAETDEPPIDERPREHTLRSPAKMPLGDWVPPRETEAAASVGDDGAVVAAMSFSRALSSPWLAARCSSRAERTRATRSTAAAWTARCSVARRWRWSTSGRLARDTPMWTTAPKDSK